jgi:hypothetical protein
MAPRWSHDVKTMPSDLHADGIPNPSACYHRALIRLTELIADSSEKAGISPCLSTAPF